MPILIDTGREPLLKRGPQGPVVSGTQKVINDPPDFSTWNFTSAQNSTPSNFWVSQNPNNVGGTGGGGTIGFIQGNSSSPGSGTSSVLAFSGAVTSGDTLVCAVRVGALATAPTFSDSVNGAWATTFSQQDAAGGDTLFIGVFLSSGAGTPTVTASWTTSGSIRQVIASYRGTNAVDQHSTAVRASSTTFATPSVTTTTANQVLIAINETSNGSAETSNVAGSAPTTWTNRYSVDTGKLVLDDIKVTSTGTYNETWSVGVADSSATAIITLKETTAGGLIAGVNYFAQTIIYEGSYPNWISQSWTYPGSPPGAGFAYAINGVGWGATLGQTPFYGINSNVSSNALSVINSLSVTHVLTLTGAGDYDAAYSFGLYNSNASVSTPAQFFTVNIYAHLSSTEFASFSGLPAGQKYTFTDTNSIPWLISISSLVYPTAGTPVTINICQSSGTDLLSATFDFKQLFTSIIAKGWFTGSEIFSGFILGNNIVSGSGGMTFQQLTLNSYNVLGGSTTISGDNAHFNFSTNATPNGCGRAIPYWCFTFPWGNSGASHTWSIQNFWNTYPNNTIMVWNSSGAVGGSYLGSPYMVYGSYNGSVPITHVTPIAINNINTLTCSHNVSISGALEGFDAIYDFFLVTSLGGSPLIEVEVNIHAPPTYAHWLSTSTFPNFTFFDSVSNLTWKAFLNATSSPATSGKMFVFIRNDFLTTPDNLVCTFNLKAMLQQAVAHGWCTGTELFEGTVLAAEVTGGQAGMTLNSFNVVFN